MRDTNEIFEHVVGLGVGVGGDGGRQSWMTRAEFEYSIPTDQRRRVALN